MYKYILWQVCCNTSGDHLAQIYFLSYMQELTFDYETTEYEIGAFSKCLCGSPNCRGKVYGYKYSGEVIRKKYCEENISSYLLQDVSLRK